MVARCKCVVRVSRSCFRPSWQTMARKATLAAALSGMLTPAAKVAFLVLQVTFIPCIATTRVIQQEAKPWRWIAFALL